MVAGENKSRSKTAVVGTQLFGAADLVGKSDHEKDQPSVG